jgi:hypothetical protein
MNASVLRRYANMPSYLKLVIFECVEAARENQNQIYANLSRIDAEQMSLLGYSVSEEDGEYSISW